MANKSKVTEAEYLAVLRAFEQVGRKNVLAVERITGRSRPFITELWTTGKPELGMKPIAEIVDFTRSSAPPPEVPPTAVVQNTPDKVQPAPAPTPAGASDSGSPSPTSSIATHIVLPGLTQKQAAVRRIEEDAILSMVNNLTGASVILSSLTKLIHEQVGLLKDIPDHTERRAMMKELGALMVQVGKVTSVLTDGIPRVMAAARLNTGQAGAITEHRHTGTVGVEVANDAEALAERERRMAHMLDMHARARAYVPGSYKGEEAGIIDAEVSEPLPEPPRTELQEKVRALTIRRVPAEEAEANLRRALSDRGMPAERVEAMLEKARTRAAELARELSDVVDDMLAQPPGQAN